MVFCPVMLRAGERGKKVALLQVPDRSMWHWQPVVRHSNGALLLLLLLLLFSREPKSSRRKLEDYRIYLHTAHNIQQSSFIIIVVIIPRWTQVFTEEAWWLQRLPARSARHPAVWHWAGAAQHKAISAASPGSCSAAVLAVLHWHDRLQPPAHPLPGGGRQDCDGGGGGGAGVVVGGGEEVGDAGFAGHQAGSGQVDIRQGEEPVGAGLGQVWATAVGSLGASWVVWGLLGSLGPLG